MIQEGDLRQTLRDIEEYQSFCETFDDANQVLDGGVRLIRETQRLQDVLDKDVSHAVQVQKAPDQQPLNKIVAPDIPDPYEQIGEKTGIKYVSQTKVQASLQYVLDYVTEDIFPGEDCYVIPRYFYVDETEYTR
jgi:hypothetical protein